MYRHWSIIIVTFFLQQVANTWNCYPTHSTPNYKVTFGIGRAATERFSTVVGETWSVVGIPVHVCQEEDPVCWRPRLHPQDENTLTQLEQLL